MNGRVMKREVRKDDLIQLMNDGLTLMATQAIFIQRL